MNNAGIYDLGDLNITGAISDSVITSGLGGVQYIDNLEGMTSCTISAFFIYGSGGTDAVVRVETTLNQGQTWIEVARFRFTQATLYKVMNLVGGAEIVAAYEPVPLSNDVGKSGILGDRWRARLTTTGTYGNPTSLAVRMMAR